MLWIGTLVAGTALVMSGCRSGMVMVSCETDADCGPGYACVDSQCHQLCTTSDDCIGEDYVCMNGMCAPGCRNDLDCVEPGPCEVLDNATCVNLECRYQLKAENSPCDDGDLCTEGTCDIQGNCVGTPIACESPPTANCSDTNTYRGYNPVGQCDPETGLCLYESFDVACADCQSNCLEPCLALECHKLSGSCRWGYCYPDGGAQCIFNSKPDGSECVLGHNPSGVCAGGLCYGCRWDQDCNDMNTCTTDTCLLDTTCEHTARDGVVCDDGDYCTGFDRCVDDVCVGTPITCTGCVDDLDCNDGNVCTNETCGEGDVCFFNVVEDTGCDDNDPCTTTDTCTSGLCAGEPYNCNDQDQCTTDTCDGAGGCDHSAYAGPCDDGNPCTHSDVCGPTGCVGTPYICDDSNICTDNICNGDGTCSYPATSLNPVCTDNDPCTNADACVSGTCVGTPNPYCQNCSSPDQCDDGNPCTDETCPDGTCHFSNNSDPCNDNLDCTWGDICTNGACVATPYSCNDFNVCTDDSCNGDSTCTHINNSDECGLCALCQGGSCTLQTADDGPGCEDACTECENGLCVGRSVGDATECPQGQSCCGDPLRCQGSSVNCPGAMLFPNGFEKIRFANRRVEKAPIDTLFAY